MEQYKKEFIEFMIDCQVLKFGDFVTKSGRKTPFFVNTGFYRTGSQLRKLGGYYAQAVKASSCFDCGMCETRCPYELPIRKMLMDVARTFGDV
jgi:orotate phosphoribosyltransferase